MGFLRRTPDAAGLNAWIGYLGASPLVNAVNGFIASPEYLSRF